MTSEPKEALIQIVDSELLTAFIAASLNLGETLDKYWIREAEKEDLLESRAEQQKAAEELETAMRQGFRP